MPPFPILYLAKVMSRKEKRQQRNSLLKKEADTSSTSESQKRLSTFLSDPACRFFLGDKYDSLALSELAEVDAFFYLKSLYKKLEGHPKRDRFRIFLKYSHQKKQFAECIGYICRHAEVLQFCEETLFSQLFFFQDVNAETLEFLRLLLTEFKIDASIIRGLTSLDSQLENFFDYRQKNKESISQIKKKMDITSSVLNAQLHLLVTTQQYPAMQEWILNSKFFTSPQPNRVGVLKEILNNLVFHAFLEKASEPQVREFVRKNISFDTLIQRWDTFAALLPVFIDNLFEIGWIVEVIQHNPNTIPWELRLEYFDKLIKSISSTHHVTADQFNSALYWLWQPQTDEDQTRKEQFPNLQPRERHLFFVNLRNAPGFTPELKREIYRFVRQTQPLAEEFSPTVLERVHLLESPYSPFALGNMIPLSGYEIENVNIDMNPQYYPILGYLGFNYERDAKYETSPGPFQHPFTALTVFGRWVNADMIPLFNRDGYVFHLNIGLKSQSMMELLTALFQLDGHSYFPRFASGQTGYVRRIYEKQSSVNYKTYFESKEFRLLSKHGFERTYYQSLMIATALTHFEVKYSKRSKLNTQVPPLTSQYADQLAELGYQLFIELKSAFEPLSLDSFLHENVPNDIIKTVIANLIRVYPDRYSHYDIDPWDVDTDIHPVNEDGVFPNLVAFAQWIIDKYAQQVEKILNNFERDFMESVRTFGSQEFAARMTGKSDIFYLDFLNRFNIRAPKQIDAKEFCNQIILHYLERRKI